MSPRSLVLPTLLGVLLVVPAVQRAMAQQTERPWEASSTRWLEVEPQPGHPHVATMIADIKAVPPDTGLLLMVGSQTAWEWNLDKWFSDFRTANVGFGGSFIDDSTFFVEELILPHEPSTLLMYMGDNDVSAGKSPTQTIADLRSFVTRVRETLPHAQFVFVSLQPSIALWETWPTMRETNSLAEEWAAGDPDVHYVDIASVTIGGDGRPRPELFRGDGLHLTELGFLEWSQAAKPAVYDAEKRYRALTGCDRWECGALR